MSRPSCRSCEMPMRYERPQLCDACQAEWRCKQCGNVLEQWTVSELCIPCYKAVRFNYTLVPKKEKPQ